MIDRILQLDDTARDFLAEADEIADRLANDLAALSDSVDGGDIRQDLLNSVFRGAHSIKGLAGIFGFNEITGLSHHLESLLDCLRLDKIKLSKPVMWLLLESQALIKLLLRDISEKGATAHSDEISACIKRISECYQFAAVRPEAPLSSGIPVLPDQVFQSMTEYERHRFHDNLEKGKNLFSIHVSYGLSDFDRELSSISDNLKSFGEIVALLPGEGDDNENQIGCDILYASSKKLEDVKARLVNSVIAIKRLEPLEIVPGSADTQTTFAPGPASAIETTEKVAVDDENPVFLSRDDALSTRSMSRTVRVDIEKLNELMNIVGELSLTHSTMSEISFKLRSQGFTRLSMDLSKVTGLFERRLAALRKGVLEIRMIPLVKLYEKLSTIVRRISREQGKMVEFKLLGSDTELDKLIMEGISDPMMHIIRNAVDHGIECPERRLTCGKNVTGVVSVSARQKGNHVVIDIEDDGSGIDLDMVRSVAQRKGLVKSAIHISDREALELIFLPGFSTSDTVTDVSGRGVGMDVVRNNINAVSGAIDIETRKGAGTRFRITLPVTLAMIKALIVSCAGRIYALPVAMAHETLLVTDADIFTTEAGDVIRVRDKELPILRLDSFLGIDRKSKRPAEYYVVVTGIPEVCLGIAVDDLFGQQDIIIKPLGEAFRGVAGVSGAADLGDRGTVLALDVGGMITQTLKNGF